MTAFQDACDVQIAAVDARAAVLLPRQAAAQAAVNAFDLVHDTSQRAREMREQLRYVSGQIDRLAVQRAKLVSDRELGAIADPVGNKFYRDSWF